MTDIQSNPLAYYDTQNLASMQQALAQASEEELTARMAPIEAAASTESQQNQAVLAAAERMKRLDGAPGLPRACLCIVMPSLRAIDTGRSAPRRRSLP